MSATTTPRKTPGPPPVGHKRVYTHTPPPPPIPSGGSARSSATVPPPPLRPSAAKKLVVKNLNFQEEKKEEESDSLDGLKSFLELVSKSTNKKKSKKLIEPRYGGLDETGTWTGSGQRGMFDESKQISNYRQFSGSEHIKNTIRVGAIQDKCQLGIQDADNMFCTSHEANSHRTVACIESFKELVVQHGMEGVFLIVTPTETINMLETPGKVSKARYGTNLDQGCARRWSG